MENKDLNSNKYSNLKGEIGILIAKEFLKEYFKNKKIKIFDTKFKSGLFKSKLQEYWKRKLNTKLIEKEFFGEKISRIESFAEQFSKSYLPDLWVSVNGKLYIVEVKTTTSQKKAKKELHRYQRKTLLEMNKFFPVLVIYLKLNISDITITSNFEHSPNNLKLNE